MYIKIKLVVIISCLMLLGVRAEAVVDYSNTAIPSDTWIKIYDGNATNQTNGTEPTYKLTAYSGMAFDPTGGRLVLFGGGHQDYGGNDVWIFDVVSGTWSKDSAADPLLTTGTPLATCQASVDNLTYPGMWVPSQKPISRHTYGSLVFLPNENAFVVGGWSTFNETFWGYPYTGCYYNGPQDLWKYSLNSHSWEYKGSTRLDANFKQLAYSNLDESENIINIGKDGNGYVIVNQYDPSTNTWISKSPTGTRPDSAEHFSTAYDSGNNRIYFRASSVLSYYDITNNAWVALSPSGTTPTNSNGDGMAYDSINNIILGWGASGMWTYNPSTNAWGTVSATGPVMNKQVFSRFAYDPGRNIVFFVNRDASGTPGVDVWAYRYATQEQVHKNIGSPKQLANKPGA